MRNDQPMARHFVYIRGRRLRRFFQSEKAMWLIRYQSYFRIWYDEGGEKFSETFRRSSKIFVIQLPHKTRRIKEVMYVCGFVSDGRNRAQMQFQNVRFMRSMSEQTNKSLRTFWGIFARKHTSVAFITILVPMTAIAEFHLSKHLYLRHFYSSF